MSNIMNATVNTFLYKIIALFLSNDGLCGEISIPTGQPFHFAQPSPK